MSGGSVTTQSSLPILIVDDDGPTQNLLRAVLRRCGYTSEVASNGREAIVLLQANAYAAVILDMMMPEVGGRDVVAFLAEGATAVPVIICSAAGPKALTGFDPAVVKAVIRKPFDIDELTTAVTAAVSSRADD
jgi:two-component system, OmpR family, response regulator ResD